MHSHQFLRLNFNERQPFQQAKRHSSVNHFSFAFTYEIWLVTSPEFERAVFLYQTQIFRQEIRSVRMTVTWTASDLEFLDETKSSSSFISTACTQPDQENLTSFAVQLDFFSDSLHVSFTRSFISSKVRSPLDGIPRDVIVRTISIISSISSISFSDIFLEDTLSAYNLNFIPHRITQNHEGPT